jgi:hypothetical protein
VFGDGMLGHAPRAPYDSIIAAAGGEQLPATWLAQLAPGGRLVAPVQRAAGQRLVVVDHTPGGLVSDLAAFNDMLTHCTTVWLQAEPEDHMRRVIAQGDMRPMAASKEAMDDLRGILAGRAAFYSKADFRLDTSTRSLQESFFELRRIVREALQLPLEAKTPQSMHNNA